MYIPIGATHPIQATHFHQALTTWTSFPRSWRATAQHLEPVLCVSPHLSRSRPGRRVQLSPSATTGLTLDESKGRAPHSRSLSPIREADHSMRDDGAASPHQPPRSPVIPRGLVHPAPGPSRHVSSRSLRLLGKHSNPDPDTDASLRRRNYRL